MKKLKLAEQIKELRTSRAWSQAQLADIASVHIRTIQRLETSGQCSHETLLAVAAAFDIDVRELVVLTKQNILFKNYSADEGLAFSFLNRTFRMHRLTSRKITLLSIILMSPALFFITASIAKYNLGIDFLFEPWSWLFSYKEFMPVFNNVLPLLFSGGLTITVLINLNQMFSVSLYSDSGKLNGNLVFNPAIENGLILTMSLLALLILLGYAFVENFVLRI
jgi:transcriptional regulator with XRE-family HTH domain